jgi:hypothetical protein
MVCTWDAGDICNVVLCEHLRLGLVELQIPHTAQVVQLLYSLLHLRLGIGQDQHVVCEGEQVASVDHLSQLLRCSQCLLQVHVEQHGGEHASLDHS